MGSSWSLGVREFGFTGMGADLCARIANSSVHYVLRVPELAKAGFYRVGQITLTNVFPYAFTEFNIPLGAPHFPYGNVVVPDVPV